MSNDAVATLKKKADVLIDMERFPDAIIALQQALARQPDDSFIRCLLAYVYYRLKDYPRMLECAETVLQNDPGYALAHHYRSRALGALDQLQPALEAAQEAVRIAPDDKTYLQHLALMQTNAEQLDAAEQTIEQLIRIAPEWSASHYRKAYLHLIRREWPESEASFREAMALDPTDANHFHSLGVVVQEQGRFVEAADCYYQGLKITPADHDLQRKLEKAAIACGFESIQEYLRARSDPALLERTLHRKTVRDQAQQLIEAKRPAEAITLLRQALEEAPEEVRLLEQLAEAYCEQDDASAALQCTETILRLAPRSWRAHIYRSRALLQVSQKPGVGTEKLGPIHDLFGYRQQVEKKARAALQKEAIQWAQKAVAIEESSLTLHALCRAQVIAERFRDAETTAKRLLEIAPNWWHSHLYMGNVYYGLSQWRAAETCYRRAVELEPNSPIPVSSLGRALRCQGRKQEARECFAQALQKDPSNAYYQANLKSVTPPKVFPWLR